MSKTVPETKRKPGRPSAKQEPESLEQVDMPVTPEVPRPAALDTWRPKPMPKAGPICERCNEPTELNSEIFKALGLNAIRCMKCKTAAIEGDTFMFELVTAASGSLLRRAKDFYEIHHPSFPVPKVKEDVIYDILTADADDPRWGQ